jgi:hypothetical protein
MSNEWKRKEQYCDKTQNLDVGCVAAEWLGILVAIHEDK